MKLESLETIEETIRELKGWKSAQRAQDSPSIDFQVCLYGDNIVFDTHIGPRIELTIPEVGSLIRRGIQDNIDRLTKEIEAA